MQLAFDHVLAPLKSELGFGKLLIINILAKYNSLQTFVSFSGGQRNNISAFTGLFPTP